MSKTPQLPEELQGLTFPQLLALAEKPQSQQMVDSSRADISGRHLLSANSSAMLDQYILYQVQKQSMGHAEECTQEELEELHHLQDVADSIRKRQMSDGHPADMSAAVSMAPQPTSAAPHAGVPAARTASTTTTQKTKGLFSLFFFADLFVILAILEAKYLPEDFCPLVRTLWHPQCCQSDYIEGATTKKLSFLRRVLYRQKGEAASAARRRLKNRTAVRPWCPKETVFMSVGDVLSLWEAPGLWVIDNIMQTASNNIVFHVQPAPDGFVIEKEVAGQIDLPPDMSARAGMRGSAESFDKHHRTRADLVVVNWGDFGSVRCAPVVEQTVILAVQAMTNERKASAQDRKDRRAKARGKSSSGPVRTNARLTSPAAAAEVVDLEEEEEDDDDDDADTSAEIISDIAADIVEDDEPSGKRRKKAGNLSSFIAAYGPPTHTARPPPPVTTEEAALVNADMSVASTMSAAPTMPEEYVNVSQAIIPVARLRRGHARRGGLGTVAASSGLALSPNFFDGVITPATRPLIAVITQTTQLLDAAQQRMEEQAKRSEQQAETTNKALLEAMQAAQQQSKVQADKLSETMSACIGRVSEVVKAMTETMTSQSQMHDAALRDKDKHTLELMRIMKGKE